VSSYEQFLEFFIRAVLNHGQVPTDVVNEAWKYVLKQSERQLGAFIFLFTLQFSETPSILKESQVELRNKVAHQGKIPARDEAIRFGSNVVRIFDELHGSVEIPDSVELKVAYKEGRSGSKLEYQIRWPVDGSSGRKTF
jgi:hypothetical protein